MIFDMVDPKKTYIPFESFFAIKVDKNFCFSIFNLIGVVEGFESLSENNVILFGNPNEKLHKIIKKEMKFNYFKQCCFYQFNFVAYAAIEKKSIEQLFYLNFEKYFLSQNQKNYELYLKTLRLKFEKEILIDVFENIEDRSVEDLVRNIKFQSSETRESDYFQSYLKRNSKI